MGRVKLPMEPINDSKKRKITFLRRKESLIKKAHQLSVLCDVNVSMIICSDHQETPEIFPRDPAKLNDMIKSYKRKRESDPGRIKSYSLCDFFKDRKNKIEVELAKEKKRKLEAKFPTPVEFLDNSSEEQLRDFAARLGMAIDEGKTKNPLLELKKSNFQNLGLQGWLNMPRLNPNPITHSDYSKNDNTSIVFNDDVESPGSSNRTSADNSCKRKRDSNPGNIKSYSLSDFSEDRKNKIEDELVKLKKRKLEARFPTPFEFLDNHSEELLRDFNDSMGTKIDEVKTKNPLLEQKKMSNFQNLGLQGLLEMLGLNPNPITTMTHFDYNKKDNTGSMFDDYVESPGPSNRTSVDNSYFPLVPMDQLDFCTDERSMEALNTCLMQSEDVNDFYDGLEFDLKPEMMQQLEQPQNTDMQRVMLSCFY